MSKTITASTSVKYAIGTALLTFLDEGPQPHPPLHDIMSRNGNRECDRCGAWQAEDELVYADDLGWQFVCDGGCDE